MAQTNGNRKTYWRPVDPTRHHRENGWVYRGRAIYHFTLAVEGRYPLFGTLEGKSAEKAFVRLNPFGRRVYQMLSGLARFYEGKGFALKVLAQKLMPDHVHLVIQVLEPLPKSIGAVVRGFKSGCTKVYRQEFYGSGEGWDSGENATEVHGDARAQEKGRGEKSGTLGSGEGWGSGENATGVHRDARAQEEGHGEKSGTLGSGAGWSSGENAAEVHGDARAQREGLGGKLGTLGSGENAAGVHENAEAQRLHGHARAQGEGHGRLVQFGRIFADKGSIWEQNPAYYHERILHAPGQLRRMIDYVKDNPRRLWLKRHNPDLFKLHRRTEVGGLLFTSLGNHFLLEWPDRQMVEVSRKATDEEVQERLQQVLAAAHNGAIIYTAAISKGEKLIARTLREKGYPLVVLLSDGFPKEGSPHEHYYKPGGVYFEACSRGQLLLLEPTEQAFVDSSVQAAVEEALRRKAAVRHYDFTPIPTTAQRYRFVALNEMARRLSSMDS